MMEPRGIRNNNPLNIRKSADKWQGQINPSGNGNGNGNGNNSSPKGDAEFVQFYSMEYGWRAAFVILCRTYYGKYGLKTIRDIVSRWAPAKENNTEAYIRHVSDYTGIAPNKVLGSPQEHPTQWLLIGYAMAVVENGKALPAVAMLKGFALANQP
ncbi:MAG: hypothetical protein IJR69_10080 [Bacteroidaceae bacterium]|nr:hypothetical protein [Bacteroidaceae bacterium]